MEALLYMYICNLAAIGAVRFKRYSVFLSKHIKDRA